MRILCLILLLTLSAAARPGVMTQDFQDADLVYVVKTLAHAMKCNVYIGPGVEGQVTVRLHSVPPVAALASILAEQQTPIAYKRIGRDTLVVASPDKVNQIDGEIIGCGRPPRRPQGSVREEFILNQANPVTLIRSLQAEYKEVEFIPHPTRPGFYAVGMPGELADLKARIPELDRWTEPPGLVEETFDLEGGDTGEIGVLLATLVPGISVSGVTPESIVIKGSVSDLEAVQELIAELNRPVNSIYFDCRLVSADSSVFQDLQIHWDEKEPGCNPIFMQPVATRLKRRPRAIVPWAV